MPSTNAPSPRTSFKSSAGPTSSFLHQRDVLVGEISMAMEQVLQNINKLNRNLEGVIAVGTEFGAVEALWSQFENVMAKEPGESEEGKTQSYERNQDEMEQGTAEENADKGDGEGN
ncbi:MAG: hypothetical protein Q9226_001782 [Calogaya cf. arnoldii]